MPLNTIYYSPAHLGEALELLSRYGSEAKVVAGGMSLLPLMNLRLVRPSVIIDISSLAGALSYIRQDGGFLTIGAVTRHRDVATSAVVAATLPLLRQAAGLIGHPQIRNRGTIGGSVAHADPSAEYPAALLCLNAEFKLQSVGGERWVPASEFFLAPLVTAMLGEELLTEVRVPIPPAGTTGAFREHTVRTGGYALVSVAGLVRAEAGRVVQACLTVGGVNPIPLRSERAEACLLGNPPDHAAIAAAAAAAMGEVEPEDDINASAEYRRHVTGVLVRAVLAETFGVEL